MVLKYFALQVRTAIANGTFDADHRDIFAGASPLISHGSMIAPMFGTVLSVLAVKRAFRVVPA